MRRAIELVLRLATRARGAIALDRAVHSDDIIVAVWLSGWTLFALLIGYAIAGAS